MRRPLIGVTGPDANHGVSWNFIAANLWLSGARMLRLTPRRPQHEAAIEGLIVSGGRDIHPSRCGNSELKPGYQYDEPRDDLECAWVNRAIAQKLPLLGICRGAQMLNVCLGGTLYQDIRLVCETAHYPDTVWSKVFARKPIVVTAGSMLYDLLGREVLQVNSLHRQSLDKIGAGLVVTAREENSIVQAVEGTDRSHFLLGVQWHPEFMINSAHQRLLFRTLVKRARRRD